MASAPLLDFDAVDLSQVVVGRDVLDVHLKQRNRFQMLDGVLHDDPEGNLIVGYKDLGMDDWWTADHIPGRPMFPGVLQIEAAAQLCAYDFSAHRHGPGDKFVGFGGVDGARFRGLVGPGCRFLMAVSLIKSSRRVFRYNAQAFVDRQMVFEGVIIGVLV